MNRSGESRQPCLIHDFKGNGFSCSTFSMMLVLSLSYVAFIMLRNIPSIPSFFRAFIINRCWILSKVFFCVYWEDHVVFCLCFCLYATLHLWIYVCWTILASLEWNWLGYGVWSFWHVVEFCLPVFCWETLHLYSLKTLVYNSFFGYVFIGFWNECNAGFIEWIW
jgi:hypothetical protein